jgi:hypothetical protein
MCVKQRVEAWREQNRERYLEDLRSRSRQRYETVEGQEKERSRGRTLQLRYRMTALHVYGGDPPRCACCGEDNYHFLSFDHINGGGRKHKQQAGIGNLAQWLCTHGFPDGFRVLCHNCNLSYGMYGFCPHTLPPDMLTAERSRLASVRLMQMPADLNPHSH